jgi:hypothetical protein
MNNFKKIIKRHVHFFIFLFVFLILIFVFYYFFKNNIYIDEKEIEGMELHKNAIVVLTKGYNGNEEYQELIDRNNSIYNIFYSLIDNKENYDIIIFHEGNITEEQQIYIQSSTPNLPLKFKYVEFLNNNIDNPKCPNTGLSNNFSIGYKNMCYFWSISFFKYLHEYDYIIRIDEDCIIYNLDINILNKYKEQNIMFSSAYYQDNDFEDVTIGLKDLFDNYLIENNLIKKNDLKMPYTNFMILNIPFFKNNIDVNNILNEIDKSNCIFSNRWGDLPIWGYILSYLIDKSYYKEDRNIVYLHGSHSTKVN